MRPSQSLVQVALCLSSCASVAFASSWPQWLPELDALVVRADSTQSATPAGMREDFQEPPPLLLSRLQRAWHLDDTNSNV